MAKAPLEMAQAWVWPAGGRGCAAHNLCMHPRAYIVCYALHYALHMRNDKWVPGCRRGILTTLIVLNKRLPRRLEREWR